MTFSEIIANNVNWTRNIRIIVGETEIFIGNENWLDFLTDEQIKWLNSHKRVHTYYSLKEITLIYRKNKNFTEMTFEFLPNNLKTLTI